MDNRFNLNESQMNGLLSMAGKKMGVSPEKLRQQMESGQAQELLSGLPQEKQAQMNELLSNPKAIENLMKNPQVQQLMKSLMGR